MVGTELRGYTGVIGLWDPCRISVFNVCVVDTDVEHYDGYTHTKSCLRTSSIERANILRLALIYDGTSHRFCSQWTRRWGSRKRWQLINCIMTC